MSQMESLLSFLNDQKVLVALITVAAAWILVKTFANKKKRIPGPPVWPIVGSLPYFRNSSDTFKDFAKKYGDIFYMEMGFMGSRPTIVLNEIGLIKEALLEKQDDFAGRFRLNTFDIMSEGGNDIVFGDFTPRWRFQRKVAHAALRRYASGKELQEHIEHSVSIISDIFLKTNEQPIDVRPPVSLIFYNITASMCFGKKYDLDHPDFKKLTGLRDDINEKFSGGTLADICPSLAFIPTPMTRLIKQFFKSFTSFLGQELKEHKENFDKADVRDLTYFLIQENEEMKEKGQLNEVDGLTDQNFKLILNNMFFAGTDTTRNTLHWALLFLAAHPEVQKKAQQEIDENLGRTGRITTTNRVEIPYCEAILYEVLRLRSPVPLGVPHQTTCDTSVGGYEVKKGTQVLINLAFLHSDPRVWENPKEFQPERFIDEKGNLGPKPAHLLPFSTGRRQCVGEAVAKTELHVIIGMLLQRFTFHPEPGQEVDLSCKEALFFSNSQDVKIVIKER